MGLGFAIELFCMMLLATDSELPSPEHCVNRRFCEYKEISNLPIVFNIICQKSDYTEVRRLFKCLKSTKEHTVGSVHLKFPVPTEVENDFLNDFQTNILLLSQVSNLPDMEFERAKSLKTLTLENGNLTEVPLSIRSLKNLTTLSISNYKLEIIPDFSFQEMVSLEILHLHSNSISKIEQSAFAGVQKLRDLWLSNNSLTVVATDAFNNLPAIKRLQLKDNQITTLESNVLQNIPSLHELQLSGNQIELVHDDAFAGLTELNSLLLSRNKLTFVPVGAIQKLSKLEVLHLSDNLITVWKPNDFVHLASLKYLQLDGNNVTSISKEVFAGLVNLTGLHLGANNLTSVPVDAIKSLSKLDTLHLSNNLISKWEPNAFYGLTSLKYLMLEGNTIDHIHEDGFAGLNMLAGLDLTGNRLTSVPTAAITKLSTLEWIQLRNNTITELKQNAFLGLHTVNALWLQNNQISTIHEHAFAGLDENLQLLYLEGNNLTRIPIEALQNMKQLTHVAFGNLIEFIEADTFKSFGHAILTISLKHNRIKSISPTAFHHLPKLDFLNLESNQLHHLDFAVFQPILNRLKWLYVMNNPLVCNCDLYWYYLQTLKMGPRSYFFWISEQFEQGECQDNETTIYLEKECEQTWKPIICNASSMYGCMRGDFCKGEVGC